MTVISTISDICEIDRNGCATGVDAVYGRSECTIRVNFAGTLTATTFNAGSGVYDRLDINLDIGDTGPPCYAGNCAPTSTRYMGTTGPNGVAVAAGSAFRWLTSSSSSGGRWTICLAAEGQNEEAGSLFEGCTPVTDATESSCWPLVPTPRNEDDRLPGQLPCSRRFQNAVTVADRGGSYEGVPEPVASYTLSVCTDRAPTPAPTTAPTTSTPTAVPTSSAPTTGYPTPAPTPEPGVCVHPSCSNLTPPPLSTVIYQTRVGLCRMTAWLRNKGCCALPR